MQISNLASKSVNSTAGKDHIRNWQLRNLAFNLPFNSLSWVWNTNYAFTTGKNPFPLLRIPVLRVKILFDGPWLRGPKPASPRGQGHTGFPSSGLPGSVFFGGELGCFIVNLSVGSHGAAVRSIAPHRDLQSLRQFLGCQLGLQLLKLNTTKRKKLTWIGL